MSGAVRNATIEECAKVCANIERRERALSGMHRSTGASIAWECHTALNALRTAPAVQPERTAFISGKRMAVDAFGPPACELDDCWLKEKCMHPDDCAAQPPATQPDARSGLPDESSNDVPVVVIAGKRYVYDSHFAAWQQYAIKLRACCKELQESERDLRRLIERGLASSSAELLLSAQLEEQRNGNIKLLDRAESAERKLAEAIADSDRWEEMAGANWAATGLLKLRDERDAHKKTADELFAKLDASMREGNEMRAAWYLRERDVTDARRYRSARASKGHSDNSGAPFIAIRSSGGVFALTFDHADAAIDAALAAQHGAGEEK